MSEQRRDESDEQAKKAADEAQAQRQRKPSLLDRIFRRKKDRSKSSIYPLR